MMQEGIHAERKKIFEELKTIIHYVNDGYSIRDSFDFSSLIAEDSDGTYIYIRLELSANEEIRCNFSTVEVGERRKGIFSRIVQGVKESEIIKRAAITSVVTEEMHNFCKKYRLEKRTTYGTMADYIIK